MSDNPYLTKEYKKKLGVAAEPATAIREVALDLPAHNFLAWQQEAYEAVMSGKNFFIELGKGAGKTYLADAIRQDMAIIDKVLEELE